MTLSVVIVNYNTCALLRACLASLQHATLFPEIIVVDNASSDGSADMVRAEFPDVTLLAQTQNRWFCGGNNMGIQAAQHEFILLLNPDTVVAPDALEKMTAFLATQPEYAGVTARLVYPDGTVQKTCSRIPTFAYLLLNHTVVGMMFSGWKKRLNAHQWYSDWQRDSDFDVEVVPGSCTLMRRNEIWLNDRLWLYFPEDDIARRVQRPFRFLADAHIEHYEKAATRNWRATEIYFRDLFIYTRQQHGIIAMLVLWLFSRPVYWGMWAKQHLVKHR
jgi:hypothetical protein